MTTTTIKKKKEKKKLKVEVYSALRYGQIANLGINWMERYPGHAAKLKQVVECCVAAKTESSAPRGKATHPLGLRNVGVLRGIDLAIRPDEG